MKQLAFEFLMRMLSEVKDPKTLFLRILTLTVFLLGYLLISSPDALIQVAKDFSREAVVETLEEERLAAAPTIAKERVGLIYGQVAADIVYVATYNPKQQNDYLKIIAREGEAGGPSFDMRQRLVIRKSTKMYLNHLSSRNYILGDESVNYSELLFNSLRMQEVGIKYLFTCPIYSIDNIYSGHIGIGFKVKPLNVMSDSFLESICEPNARAIGRYL